MSKEKSEQVSLKDYIKSIKNDKKSLEGLKECLQMIDYGDYLEQKYLKKTR